MHSWRGLTWPLKQPRFDLFTLMEDPPPVPPKDPAYASRMDIERPLTAPSSGSKRKRSVHDENYHIERGDLENVDPDAHTPKRNRPAAIASADEEATPAQHRSIRRKKGMSNLSNLNLRHAAAKQAQLRGSKFQEGSLTDKPSDKPPSVFTKMPHSESDNSLRVDEMMEDYHDDVAVPRYSTIKQPHAHPRATVNMETYGKNEGTGLYRFGRQLAASFNPATLWQRWWNEPKDEPMQGAGVADEKARQKAEAEARYAEMKKNGQFEFQAVRRRVSGVSEDMETPRDSAIEIDDLQNTRAMSRGSGLMPPVDDTTSRSESEVPDTASKQNKTLKSRLHFKKPSLSNIKDDLKRVKSDLNLGAAARQRESSSSMSPVKQDFENSALKKSQSKFDLKKTHKLSKRVSDLEVRLEQAKKELDDALVDASPAPKLPTKYPTFKPSSTFRKSKFVPGKLPSLPSERILMAEQMKEIRGDSENEVEPRKGLGLSEDEFDGNINDETVKASRGRQYPTRASTLFNLDNDNTQDTTPDDQASKNKQSSDLTQLPTEEAEEMDPNSITNGTADDAPKKVVTEAYTSLDAKLRALDKNVKAADKAKQSKGKKRKSNGDDDKPFRPGKESDDGDEWEEATPKKRRKSGGANNDSSPKTARANGTSKKTSPRGKKAKNELAKATRTTVSQSQKTIAQQDAPPAQDLDEVMEDAEAQVRDDEFSPEEFDGDTEGNRTSLESLDRTLDVVYEEEELATSVPERTPSKPAAKPAPPRFGIRSRSNSPHKRSAAVQLGVEEQIMMRAATAVKQHPGRAHSRSTSPPPGNGYTKTTTVEETVSVHPGENGVPKLPRGANGSFESLDELEAEETGVEVLSSKHKKPSFEWPEDVF